MIRYKFSGDGDVAPSLTSSHPHNVLLPQLDLLDGLDHVEGEGDGADGSSYYLGKAPNFKDILANVNGNQTADKANSGSIDGDIEKL